MITSERVRALIAEHGIVRPQPASEWKGTFPLPLPVEQFYRDIGPVDVTIRGYGNPYFLPSLSQLWDVQAGYRWDGITGERLSEWDDNWLVVADEGGDPFIFDATSEAVLLAQHGTGQWEPDVMFAGLNTMAACLASLGGVVAAAGRSFTDDQSYIRPEHRLAALRSLQELLGSHEEAEAVLSALGWG